MVETKKYKFIRCRKISKGKAQGKVIKTKDTISFLGGVDPKTGIVVDKGHELYNKKISDKILVIPGGKGSTVGSYVLFQMTKNQTAPKAIISLKAEPIIAIGAIMAGIPLVDMPEADVLNILKDGDIIQVDADSGIIKIIN
jgi:phosphomecalonate degydratase small subunit